MSRLPWADVRARNLRDFGACPVCGRWVTSWCTGTGPRTVLRCCGVRWRIGVRLWRESYRNRQLWGDWR